MFEARTLILWGLMLSAWTFYAMIGFTTDTSAKTIVIVNLVQGFAISLLIIPGNTVAFLTMPAHLRTSGTSMLTLIRNTASSIGISLVIANLTGTTTAVRSQLAEHINPFNDALKVPDVASIIDLTTDQGRALVDQMLTVQATVIAYANDFKILFTMCLAAMPFVLLIGSTRALREARSRHAASRNQPPAAGLE